MNPLKDTLLRKSKSADKPNDFTISNAEMPRTRKARAPKELKELPEPAKELNGEVIKMEKRGRKSGAKAVATKEVENVIMPGVHSIATDIDSVIKDPMEKKVRKHSKHADPPEHWIQAVVERMHRLGTEGAFTKSAKRHKETPKEYAKEVLEHPEKHTMKTKRRAQFVENVSKHSKKDSESESDVDIKPKKKRGHNAERMAIVRSFIGKKKA